MPGLASPLATFGPVSTTLNGPNQSAILPCPGAASVLIELSGTFTGSIVSANSADQSLSVVSPARLWMSGVGSLGKSTITGTGAAQTAEYRAVAGGSLYLLTTSADFAGSATVTMFATQAGPISFVHGAVHDSDEEALRAGRSFTLGTGIATVASGNSLVLYISNPAGSGVRLFIQDRYFTASRADTLAPVGPPFFGLKDPTSAPTSAVTVASRGDGSVTCPAIARFNVVNAANLAALGGTITAGNLTGGGNFNLALERTLEPGKAFANYMTNTSSGGLGGAFDMLMAIAFGIYQEPV